MFNTIETPRLILRPWHADEVEELERLFADPAVRQGRHLPPKRMIAIAEGSLRQWQLNRFGPWVGVGWSRGSHCVCRSVHARRFLTFWLLTDSPGDQRSGCWS